MKHNFPNHLQIACKTENTLKEVNEVLHLSIDSNCPVYSSLFSVKINTNYPKLFWDKRQLSRTKAKLSDKEYIWVSFEEFKAFLQGKGTYKEPFKQELQLNSQYKAVITKDFIKVGCQEFPHDVIKKLYQISQKALKS